MYNKAMNTIRKNISKISFLFLGLLAPLFSFALTIDPGAGDPDCASSGKICNPINANTVNEFIKTILEGAIKIGIPIIALAIIYSGFLFVAARGNSEKLEKAKDALMYTLIGAAILLGAWTIAQVIAETILKL